jgi:hypothetical protein
MNRITRHFVTAAAAAAVTLAATPARADHEEHGRDCDRHAYAPAVYAPAPAPAVVYVPVHSPAPVYAPAPAPQYRPARVELHRRSEELSRDYRELDAARGRFYATWHGNPVRRDRFEAWYGQRRADLDRRSAEHERGERWAYGR